MKYWLLTTEYPPFFGGGIGTYSYNTAQMLAKQKHQVTVFVNDSTVSGIKTINSVDNLRIIRFNPSSTKSSSFLGHVTNISYEFAQIVRLFINKEGRPDIIEAQEYLGIAYYLLQYKYLLYEWCKDIPIIITMHSPSYLYMQYNHISMYTYPNYWICEMELFCLEAADQLISPSLYMIKELERNISISASNFTVIPNPYEKEKSNVIDPAETSNEIIFYGKLTAQKGAFELMQYFKQIWDEGFSKSLYLVGGQDIVYHPEGRTMGDLLRSRYKNYIDKGLLHFEGKIKPTELNKRLANATVVIVPSNNDNLPYTVMEIMALGKIVLASEQGGHIEIIQNKENGFVFDHKKPETFSLQLKYILELNDEERKKIENNAAQTIKERYNHSVIYNKKIKLIEDILQRKQTNPVLFPFVHKTSVGKIPDSITSVSKKLSIVVPYYNMGKYIEETMDSLLKSDYPDKEIIIVNDGSSERQSIEKVSQFEGNIDIRIIHSANKGLANARNMGAEAAKGEYLTFLDADDKVEKDYYSKAIPVLENYDNIHFVGCWTKYFDGSTDTWPGFTPEPPLILFHNLVNSSSLVYKRKSFLCSGRNDDKMVFAGLEDYDSVLSMIENGLQGVVIPEKLFEYRVRKNSMIRSISIEKKLFLFQYMSGKHKELYSNFSTGIFNLLNANGPGLYLDNPSLDFHLAKKIPFGGKFSLKVVKFIKHNKYAGPLAYKLYRIIKK